MRELTVFTVVMIDGSTMKVKGHDLGHYNGLNIEIEEGEGRNLVERKVFIGHEDHVRYIIDERFLVVDEEQQVG